MMTSLPQQPEKHNFLPVEAIPGVLLMAAAASAMLIVNSPLADLYHAILETNITVGPTGGGIEMKLAYWIKNGLMAVFFLFVGLELKREILEGQLSNPAAAALPIMAAIGGMAVPAMIFLFFAKADGYGHGWAIPAATDIAFALGVLSLLGKRVPPALKAFLLAVAVVDDLGAIVIVAVFYTEHLISLHLMQAGVVMGFLLLINHFKVKSITAYILLGVVLWVFLHQSGVSGTLAGVLVGSCIPLHDAYGQSPLLRAEHSLRPWVLFGIMPLFAFAFAGVELSGLHAYFTHPITLGAGFGLMMGKPLGILATSLLAATLMKAKLPGSMFQLLGIACLAGIGFTMSLFIGALAFKDPSLATPTRLGVYAGSVISAFLGLFILAQALPAADKIMVTDEEDETAPFIKPEPDYEA
ncbi:Na+/H+ antiporter NhaA [Candidatus Phycosocius spiralis]|uniref:Na(+)/H(+) antiporter NhaA n=1 Tax=Candidatus Phycosocius spiralis TaxID=2815099 RepID=A0ABQ4PTQ6_9PROT|nr:Na+/H+ antiporter NhaA [Candidatus Phycosocius spiralis]GIU66359.1 Na(+)/H(+) antiporter NhaA 1 [Candidatus Phycosocius spiralis]